MKSRRGWPDDELINSRFSNLVTNVQGHLVDLFTRDFFRTLLNFVIYMFFETYTADIKSGIPPYPAAYCPRIRDPRLCNSDRNTTIVLRGCPRPHDFCLSQLLRSQGLELDLHQTCFVCIYNYGYFLVRGIRQSRFIRTVMYRSMACGPLAGVADKEVHTLAAAFPTKKNHLTN